MGELAHVAESGTGGTPVRELDYTYDALNRLTFEESRRSLGGGGPVIETSTTYTYDDVGNRLAKDVCSGDPLVCDTTTYAYNDNNQLVTETAPDETVAYFYDTNGSLVEKDIDDGTDVLTTTYAYDAKNRMIGAETPDDDLGFVYDVDGIRVAKTVNGSVTNFLIDKVQPYAQVVEERNAAGSLIASYTYGNDLVSQQRGASTAYYSYDGLGSTRALTDATGAVTDSYTYDAFGTTTAESGSTENAYRFTGEQFEAGLQFYYLRARYYDPSVGRFGVMDSWGGTPIEPLTINKYLYANADPTKYLDFSGNSPLTEFLTSPDVTMVLDKTVRVASVFGQLVHTAIQMDLESRYGGLVDTAVPIPGGGPLGYTGEIDVVYMSTQIYDIKPFGYSTSITYKQLNRYQTAGLAIGIPYTPGGFPLNGIINPPAPLLGIKIRYMTIFPGIIYYTPTISEEGYKIRVGYAQKRALCVSVFTASLMSFAATKLMQASLTRFAF